MSPHYSLKILAEFYAWVILTSMLIRRVICGQRHSTACSVRSVSFSMFVFRLMRKVIHSTWSWLMLDILHSYGNLVPHYKAMFKVTIIHYVLTSLVPNRINHPKSYSFVNGLIWIWNTSSRNFLLVWLTADRATSDVNIMVDVYNQTLKSCLDDLLPARSKTITEHFNCPCYNDEIRAAKQCRRKLERQWRKSRSDHHRALYVNQCKFVTTLLKRAKAEYYQTKVIECKKDQKALFRVLNELMHRNNNDGNVIANGIPCDDLAERLTHYFIEKIDHIRDHLVNTPDLTNIDHPVTVVPSSPLFSLSAFKHVREKAAERAVQSRPSKHCPLDPIPTWLLKNSIDILAPYLTELANQSFSSGVFPYDLKTAILKPLLKKLGLDPENFENLGPISNIALLSKLLESLACEQYMDHLKKM